AEDGIRDRNVTGVQTCALPILKLLKDKRLQLVMIIGIFLSLLLTHIFGVEVNGKSRWLEVPLLGRFQPSEFLKIVVILYLAYIYNQKYKKHPAQRAENLLPPSAGGWYFISCAA